MEQCFSLLKLQAYNLRSGSSKVIYKMIYAVIYNMIYVVIYKMIYVVIYKMIYVVIYKTIYVTNVLAIHSRKWMIE